jgi:DNA-binding transcriptional activator of the SARP family
LLYLDLAQPSGFARRDRLVAIFWPELDTTHARNALSKSIHYLRHDLGEDAIITRGDEVMRDPAAIQSDVRALDQALSEKSHTRALELYRGPLADGLFVADAPEFERWLDKERNQRRSLVANAAWELADESRKNGRLADAVAFAKKAASLDKEDEPSLRRLMSLLENAGDRVGALRAYDEFAGWLKAEFDAEPSPATRALHASIRASNATHLPGPESRDRSLLLHKEPGSEVDRLVSLGNSAWRRGISGGPSAEFTLQEGRAYFERALELNPRNPRALCGMSNFHKVMAIRGFANPEESEKLARQFLFAALAADHNCAEVHAAMGAHALYYEDDFYAAARHFARALELDPDDPEGLRFQSIVYKILGQTDDAIASARALTIRTPDVSAAWNGLGDVLLAAGRNAEAVDVLKKAIQIQPNYGPALERLELAYYRIGETDPALDTRVSRLSMHGHGGRAEIVAYEAAEMGYAEARRRDVQRELDEALEEAVGVDPFADYMTSRTLADRITIAYSELGDWTKAMDWVEKSYRRRPGRLRRMLTDQLFDRGGLATDPRYARLLRTAGLDDLLT